MGNTAAILVVWMAELAQSYQAQARYAVADSYDRAAKTATTGALQK